jgi:hypothetical protein
MKWTKIVVSFLVVLALGWEFYALSALDSATISEMVWNLTAATPLVPFSIGVLCGHWFMPKGLCVHCGKRPWAK